MDILQPFRLEVHTGKIEEQLITDVRRLHGQVPHRLTLNEYCQPITRLHVQIGIDERQHALRTCLNDGTIDPAIPLRYRGDHARYEQGARSQDAYPLSTRWKQTGAERSHGDSLPEITDEIS
ncbi:hypothetical protein D3C81_627500 [compost metagenome]